MRSCIPARANEGRRIVTRGLRLEENKMRAEIEISPETKTRQEKAVFVSRNSSPSRDFQAHP